MERILEINHELVSGRSPDDILHRIVEVAADLARCETAGILLFDESSYTLRFVAASQHNDRLFNLPVPIDASIAGAAFRSNEPIVVHDTRLDSRYYSKIAEQLNYPAYSLLAVPLEFRGHKLGVLEAENKKDGRSFDTTDAQMLTVLAAQATVAIENARQLERYKRMAQAEHEQRQMAEALRLASAALTDTLDYDQVIDRILEHLNHVIPYDTSNVMMIETDNIARVFRGRGYARFGTAETLNETTLDVGNVLGLRRMRESQQPIVIPDVSRDPDWVYSRPEHKWIQSYIGAPIVARGVVVGFLNAMSVTLNLYNQTHAEHLQAFAYHAAIAIENARIYRHAHQEIAERIRIEQELRRHQDRLEEQVKERTAEMHRLAITDSLTNLYNRRHLMLLGSHAFRQAQRYHHPLAALMLDLDSFKQINDTYGHVVGDEALKKLADLLRHHLRSADIVGRYGGDEFVVLMPETTLETAQQSAERLRQAIHAIRISAGSDEIGLDASIGVAALHHTDDANPDTLIHRADQAMYAIKQAKRN